jgi:hypothetical protein
MTSGESRAAAGSLARALAESGIVVEVEARGTLALLKPDASWTGLGPGARQAVVAQALQHGFTHVAMEIPGDAE